MTQAMLGIQLKRVMSNGWKRRPSVPPDSQFGTSPTWRSCSFLTLKRGKVCLGQRLRMNNNQASFIAVGLLGEDREPRTMLYPNV